MLVTYARLDPAELYHVSREGLAGGGSRALVHLNFPTAVVAPAIAVLAADALRPSRRAAVTAVAAVLLSAVVALPGVVDQDDLDARPVNTVPAAGVALAAVLAWCARGRLRSPDGRLAGDGLRIALALALALTAIPWLFAELGFYAPDPILADEVPPGERTPAVHLGSHHGTHGVLLATAALLLTRLLPGVRGDTTRDGVSAYLALMLAYGIANAAQDAWLEQVVKRGWTEVEIPALLEPSPRWALLAAVAAAVELLWLRPERRAAQRRSRKTSSAHSDIGT